MARFNSQTLWTWSGLCLALSLIQLGAFACRSETSKAPPPPPPEAPYNVPVVSVRTTSANIARANLDALIDNAERMHTRSPSESTIANVVGLRLERARYYGTYEDFDRAEELTRAVTTSSSSTQRRLRAKVLARLHLFTEALTMLEGVETTSDLDARALLATKASIWAATGKSADAREQLRAQKFDTGTASERFTLAAVEAAAGNFEAADGLYGSTLTEYKDSSPYYPAATYFALGVMWSERAGKAERGELLYAEALKRLPDYVVANVHAAEIDVERGRAGLAEQNLARLETTDPEPQGLLSEILREAGKTTEADAAQARALQGYEDLLAKHRAAFADHAAEFFLGPGKDVARALQLALENLEVRHSERAYSLAIRAAQAAGKKGQACELLEEVNRRQPTGTEISEVELSCPAS